MPSATRADVTSPPSTLKSNGSRMNRSVSPANGFNPLRAADSSVRVDSDEKIGFFRGMALLPAVLRARKNPDEARLEELLPPEGERLWTLNTVRVPERVTDEARVLLSAVPDFSVRGARGNRAPAGAGGPDARHTPNLSLEKRLAAQRIAADISPMENSIPKYMTTMIRTKKNRY